MRLDGGPSVRQPDVTRRRSATDFQVASSLLHLRTQKDRHTSGGRNLLMEQLEDRTLLAATLLSDGAISNWTDNSKAESGPATAQNIGGALQVSTETAQAAALDGAINAPPVATDDVYVVNENSGISVNSVGGVLANDHDVDSEDVTAALVNGPSHGALTLFDDGSFTHTPDPDFNREDSFQYVANDGVSDSDIATVTITVATEYPWHNGIEPLNVNDDGYYKGEEYVNFITPLDALLVINELNSNGRHKLTVDRPRPLAAPFLDENRDGFVTPLDALWLINFMISRSRSVEAESSVAVEKSGVIATGLESRANRDSTTLEVASVSKIAAEPVGSLLPPYSGLPSAKAATDLLSAEEADTEWAAEDLETALDQLTTGSLGR